MNNKIYVLGEGYARKWEGTGWEASSSVTLIQTTRFNIICDPGPNTNILDKGLEEHGLDYHRDINWVFLTHMHFDHCKHMASFGGNFIDYESWYTADKQDLHDGVIPGTNLKILKTPGHTLDHASLIVPVGKLVYAVAGDVFWWAEDEEQLTDRKSLLEKKDALAVDQKALRKSRETILGIADFVIPGHGKTFKVE
ncbi:hypothetical protein CO018_00435 [Candidatus Beckwithbacteria bacterium CG_4_9_14_0_2_um_filter_47_11]|uniref:Metallo-beta-lactamase domain-containing protein 1 n=2 Tax=Candidatus Beckwithiibacteriota TaxID=1752726 RepID=A0A2M8G503_9BACT|nr:MAG: hypothetical protein CO018_00435 [Candidatus Beckwithbacteria bacterium CG_4_9_14_0_2_um_filter_47_11]